MKIPHKHAEFIRAWADGEEIECSHDGVEWGPSIFEPFGPNWRADFYRIKPELKYPKTSLAAGDIAAVFHNSKLSDSQAWEEVANAAIKQHIIDTEGEGK